MNKNKHLRDIIEDTIAFHNGILRLEPAWVARDSMPPGNRLGLAESQVDVGVRGWISERWLASTTRADNRYGPEDEGLSYFIGKNGQRISLESAVQFAGAAIMGDDYARTHAGLGRLAKIFDMSDRIAFHYHQQARDAALVGRNPKEEAYYFPKNVNMGRHPETFFGVHPYIAEGKNYEILLPYLIDWSSDLILKHSRAYQLVPGEGFHVPAGVPHAPGTALTIELQEDSDVFGVLQAFSAGKIIPKDLLFKDIRKQDRDKFGERFVLGQIDWETSGDPYFYENRRLIPFLIESTNVEAGQEYWIFYNTIKFSGKKLVVRPGRSFHSVDNGVYNVLVWQGQGEMDGQRIEAGNPIMDELLVVYDKATRPIQVKNTSDQDLILFKFFGPDINPEVPKIKPYQSTSLVG
jgi:hypothetical protein